MPPETVETPVPHSYPLAVRNSSMFSAIGLLMQTLPFYDDAAMRLYGGVEDVVYRNLK